MWISQPHSNTRCVTQIGAGQGEATMSQKAGEGTQVSGHAVQLHMAESTCQLTPSAGVASVATKENCLGCLKTTEAELCFRSFCHLRMLASKKYP